MLRRGYGKNVLPGTAFKGDGSFSSFAWCPCWLQRWPPEPGDDQKPTCIDDPEEFKRKLGEKTMPNFYCGKEALRLGRAYGEGRTTWRYCTSRSAHDAVLLELGLTPEQTTYLDEYGHLGQNDQLLSLDLGLKAGKVKDGDIISMVGAGLGFVWASAVMRWGSKA